MASFDGVGVEFMAMSKHLLDKSRSRLRMQARPISVSEKGIHWHAFPAAQSRKGDDTLQPGVSDPTSISLWTARTLPLLHCSPRMNVPNQLTVSRFVLTAAFLAVFFARFPFSDTVALALFVAAGLTDFFEIGRAHV